MTTAHVYRGAGVALDRPHDWRDWAATVRAECLQHALTFPERHGIWGGLSERQRKRLRAKKGQA